MDQGFASNEVITSKYTWWNFLFIFLYENLNPLNKFANFYFVCVAICEVKNVIYELLLLVYSCNFNYKWKTRVHYFSTFCPFSRSNYIQYYSCQFLLVVVKDDINRHRADKKTNGRCIEVLNRETMQFEEIPQSRVRVGDIVQVYEGDIFPADLIFLRSSDNKSPKTCWVNTKSLDGETDNKFRQALKVRAVFQSPFSVRVNVMALLSTVLLRS